MCKEKEEKKVNINKIILASSDLFTCCNYQKDPTSQPTTKCHLFINCI